MIKREDDVERQYVKEREAEGKLVLKVKVLGRPGYPDRLVLGDISAAMEQAQLEFPVLDVDGNNEAEFREAIQRIVAAMFHFTELKKTAKSRYQPKQKPTIAKLRKMGYRVDVVHG